MVQCGSTIVDRVNIVDSETGVGKELWNPWKLQR
jgi:hypothetical protein